MRSIEMSDEYVYKYWLNRFTYELVSVVVTKKIMYVLLLFFFFQAEDGIRDLVRSRGLGDVYKRQGRDMRDTGTKIKNTATEFFFWSTEIR